jgi:hypothetical protein
VICNLQKTPRDGKADVIIHAYVDDVMRGLMQGLGLAFPLYRAVCRFHVVLDLGDTHAGIVCERRQPCPPIYRICTYVTPCAVWKNGHRDKQWQSFSNDIARHHSCPQPADQTSPWHRPTIRPYERRLVPGSSQCPDRRCTEHLPYR